MGVFDAKIVSIDGTPTQRIRLETDDFRFRAGQYLEVVHPSGTRIPLSIASSPSQLPSFELHYRSTPGNPQAQALDELLQGTHLQVSPAAGEVVCPTPTVPLVVIAGGTGAAQAFSLCTYRAEHEASRTHVVWCADRNADLYAIEQLRKVTTELTVCVDNRRTSDNEGLVWIDQHASQFQSWSVVIAGSPQFVYLVTDLLARHGIEQPQMQSDVFQYAPR